MLFLCGIMYTNYCLLVFYIILNLYSTILAQVLIIAKENPFKGASAGYVFFYVILGISIAFNITAVYFVFLAYRVFKYESTKGNNSAGNMAPGNQNMGRQFFGRDEEQQNNNRPQQQQSGINRQAFQGT